MNGLTQSQKLQYTAAAATFIRIQAFNDTIKTNRQLGNISLSYYVFANNTEKETYRLGQFVLSQNDPSGATNGYYNDVVQI
jgi:chorismate-pyruvate lyase